MEAVVRGCSFRIRPEVASPKNCGRPKAIGERAMALLQENGHNHSEKEALASAHVALNDLKRSTKLPTLPLRISMGEEHERIGEKGLA